MDCVQNNVIALLDASGKSDAEIEKDLHLPRSTVYDWRNGRSKSYKKYISEIAHAIDAAYQSGRKSTRAEVDEDGNDIVWLQIGNDFPLYGIEWHERDGKFTAKCLTK